MTVLKSMVGHYYETIVINHFIKKGFSLICRNILYKKFEFDAVLKRSSITYFLEVRYRDSNLVLDRREYFSPKKHYLFATHVKDYAVSHKILNYKALLVLVNDANSVMHLHVFSII